MIIAQYVDNKLTKEKYWKKIMNKFESKLKLMRETCANMYRLGWDERNGGNISIILEEDETTDFTSSSSLYPTFFDAEYLAGKYILVTGTGKYFKNVYDDPENNLGVIRISDDGASYSVVWGFKDGSAPTSELPTHLMNHIERLKKYPKHRVVLHCHPLNVLAMTSIVLLDDVIFTKTLWKMITECIIVFPDGVGVLEWMICGGNEIGLKTAEKMKNCRCVVWAHHGIFGTGNSLDEAFGLVETIEKAAAIYMKICGHDIISEISDSQLKAVADAFGITVREGYLDC